MTCMERASLNYATTEFRTEAASVSSQVLHQHRLPDDPSDLTATGLSLCIPAIGDPEAKRKRLTNLLLLNAVIPLALTGIGLLTAIDSLQLSRYLPVDHRILLIGGIALGVLGYMGIITASNRQNAMVRRDLRAMNADTAPFQPTEKPAEIGIEDPATQTKIKVLTEDRAILFCDASRRLIVIEGLFYRYVIRAEDVVGCVIGRIRPYPIIFLEYRIGGTETLLKLSLSYVTLGVELKRQLAMGAGKPVLALMLERTFGFAVDGPIDTLPGGPAGATGW
jgi:hypothetical protein